MPLSAGAVLWIADIGLAVGSLRRRPVLLISLCATTACDAAISASIAFQNLPVLGFATLVADLAEGNIVIAQGRLPTSSRPHSAIATSAIFMASGLAYIIGPLGGRQTGRSDACSVVQRCNTILGKLRVTGPDHPYCPCSLPRGQGTPPATPPPSARDLRQPIAGLCQPTAAAVLYC